MNIDLITSDSILPTDTKYIMDSPVAMRAWCTLVMLNDNYSSGALVVAKSLRRVKTKYPIYCLVAEVSDECVAMLTESGLFDRVIQVPLLSKETNRMNDKQEKIYRKWISSCYTKWNIMNPDIFDCKMEKVMLLDADSFIQKNYDHIFDLACPAACFNSPWGPKGSGRPNWKTGREVTPYELKVFLGSKAPWVGCASSVLLQPNKETYEKMLDLLNEHDTYGHKGNCISGPDEQLLAHTYFSLNESMYHFRSKYNWFVGQNHTLGKGETPVIYQYYNSKPWREDRQTSQYDDVREWYSMWDNVVADYPIASDWLNRPY